MRSGGAIMNENVFMELWRAFAGLEIRNVHERRLGGASVERAGALIDNLAGPDDRLWPANRAWPPMRFARRAGGLREGLRGGHGPIGYFVERYEPGRRIVFRFIRPAGLEGVHGLEVVDAGDAVVVRHEIVMRLHGLEQWTWPLVFRWLHDALLEDALDNAERELSGTAANPAEWSWYVRLLRSGLKQPDRLEKKQEDGGTVQGLQGNV